MSISSAISIAMAVWTPWPTSVRTMLCETVPSGLTVTVTRLDVGSAASLNASLRSYMSATCGLDGTGSTEGPTAWAERRSMSGAAATTVDPASR
jgi:hypothetical protein